MRWASCSLDISIENTATGLLSVMDMYSAMFSSNGKWFRMHERHKNGNGSNLLFVDGHAQYLPGATTIIHLRPYSYITRD